MIAALATGAAAATAMSVLRIAFLQKRNSDGSFDCLKLQPRSLNDAQTLGSECGHGESNRVRSTDAQPAAVFVNIRDWIVDGRCARSLDRLRARRR